MFEAHNINYYNFSVFLLSSRWSVWRSNKKAKRNQQYEELFSQHFEETDTPEPIPEPYQEPNDLPCANKAANFEVVTTTYNMVSETSLEPRTEQLNSK